MKKVVLYLILVILPFVAMFCTDFETETQVAENVDELPDQESWDVHMRFTRVGKNQAVLNAGYIAKFSKKRYALLKEGVKVDFYDKDGNLKSTLNSAEGKVFDDSNDMIATGSVVVTSLSGNKLYCEELHWKNKEEKIISNVPVKIITSEADTLYGDTFKSDPDLANYEITNTRGTSKKTISIDE